MLKLPSNQPRPSKCHASDEQALAALASCVVCPELLGFTAIAAATADPVPVAGQPEFSAACEKPALDAVQTTLMLFEFQQWCREQVQAMNLDK